MTCAGDRPCGCAKCGDYTLDTKGRRPEEARVAGTRLSRPWHAPFRGEPDVADPMGGKIRVVDGPGPYGTRRARAWSSPERRRDEAPGLPRGAELGRPWVDPARREDSGRSDVIRFGTRPTMEERAEFQLPVGGQEFMEFITKLPSDPVLRAEAARMLMSMQRVWLPFARDQALAVDIEWRMDVLRAWAQVTALLPATWVSIGVQLITSRAAVDRLDALRGLATVVMSIAPQYYGDAINLLGGSGAIDLGPLAGADDVRSDPGVPTDQWVVRLRQFADAHPKWVTPPTALTTTAFAILPTNPLTMGAQQFVPPPPAPQSVCVVTEFDPAWGAPPSWYHGAPLRFDPRLGAYEYDYDTRGRYTTLSDGSTVSLDPSGPGNPDEIATIRRTYQQNNAVIQPYKRSGSSAWEFRWIARDRRTRCNPL